MIPKINYKNVMLGVVVVLFLLVLGFWAGQVYPTGQIATEINFQRRTLDKYSIPALKENGVNPGVFALKDEVEEENYSTGLFEFEFEQRMASATVYSCFREK